jgi:protein gp37
MENSAIAWTDHTFNPWIGCTRVGPGCDHCYAEALDQRFDGGAHWGPGAPRRRTSQANWANLRRWDRDAERTGARPWVFVASMADVFDNEVAAEFRADLWELIRECRNLNIIIVSKRIGNAFVMLPLDWRDNFRHCGLVATVVTQKEFDRDAPRLLNLKTVYGTSWIGVSIEPQLEAIVPAFPDLDWIITGGESDQGGAEGREYSVAWALKLLRFGAAFGVPIFVKQLGSRIARYHGFKDRAGADPSEWPKSLRVRQMPRGVPTRIERAA